VHLPPTPRLAAEHALKSGRMLPSMDAERMTRAVQIAVRPDHRPPRPQGRRRDGISLIV
jgi:pyrrolidone-carboxylate peptidase